jgi:tripartite-type tricarboxylate transporter receptor subunit TctC
MEKVNRNFVGLIVTVGLIIALGVPVLASEYPNQPITMLIPYGAGGVTDLNGRALAKGAEQFLGQPIICENKPGAGGTLAPSLVLRRPPDGYTLGYVTSAPTIAYHMGKSKFHPIDDLTLIMRWGGQMMGIVVRADSPWKTIQDFVEYAKKNPKKISYGSAGVGTPLHLAMEELAMVTGMELIHIPYKSSAEVCTALLGGHVDIISESSTWIPLVDAGKFRLLAKWGERRSKKYPNVPSTKEIYNLIASAYLGLMGPKGLPKPIVEKIDDAFKKATNDSDFKAVMEKHDMDIIYLNSEDYRKFVQQDFDKVGRLVEKLGLKGK